MIDTNMLTAIRHLEAAARSMDCCPDDARAIIQFLHEQRDSIIRHRLDRWSTESAEQGRNR